MPTLTITAAFEKYNSVNATPRPGYTSFVRLIDSNIDAETGTIEIFYHEKCQGRERTGSLKFASYDRFLNWVEQHA